MSKIAYILSDNRSGSTLLDQLLGGHSGITSLGEVHHIVAYARQDRSLYNPVHPLDCYCGQPIQTCPFWTRVAIQLGRPLDTLQLQLRYLNSVSSSAGARPMLQRIPRRFARHWPQMLRYQVVSKFYGSNTVGADSFALFDAITEISAAKCLVDSSKSPFRFRALYDFAPQRVYGIVLVRDYRGTVHSKMKRGQSMEVAARDWAARIRQASRLTADLPTEQLLRLKYEDLCDAPREQLTRICEFLQLDFEDTMLTRQSAAMHHLGGSPSKFDPARRQIERDRSYLNAFSGQDLRTIRRLVGDAAAAWGYD